MISTEQWIIEFGTDFNKKFKHLEKIQQQRIMDFLEDRVLPHKNPRLLAKPLSGSLRGYWRFRVGDYRIIADIQEEVLTIVALDLGHRKEVYN